MKCKMRKSKMQRLRKKNPSDDLLLFTDENGLQTQNSKMVGGQTEDPKWCNTHQPSMIKPFSPQKKR